METWQLCPKCKGESKNNNPIGNTCGICNNTGIISVLNGKPPMEIHYNGYSQVIPYPPATSQTITYSTQIADSMRSTFKRVNKKV